MKNCQLECGLKIKSITSHMDKCKNKHLLGTTYLKCEIDWTHIVKREKHAEHVEMCRKSKILVILEFFKIYKLIKIVNLL